MKEQMIGVYHKVMRRENFEKAALDLVKLLAETQRKVPGRPRALYLDIDGHRNKEGGFDDDMMELQQEFAMGFLMEFFTEMNLPLGKVINQRPQNNDVPEQLEIIGPQKSRRQSATRCRSFTSKITAIPNSFPKRTSMDS